MKYYSTHNEPKEECGPPIYVLFLALAGIACVFLGLVFLPVLLQQ